MSSDSGVTSSHIFATAASQVAQDVDVLIGHPGAGTVIDLVAEVRTVRHGEPDHRVGGARPPPGGIDTSTRARVALGEESAFCDEAKSTHHARRAVPVHRPPLESVRTVTDVVHAGAER